MVWRRYINLGTLQGNATAGSDAQTALIPAGAIAQTVSDRTVLPVSTVTAMTGIITPVPARWCAPVDTGTSIGHR